MKLILSKRAIVTLLFFATAVSIVSFSWGHKLRLVTNIPSNQNTSTVQTTKTSTCIGDEEIASSKVENNPQGGGLVVVSVKDKMTNVETKNLRIPILDTEHVHPAEFRNCNIYVMRKFKYDYQKKIYLPGYSAELWKYDYNGSGSRMVVLGNKELNGKENAFFQFDFHVNYNESYITLTRGYLGSSDYAVVVKDLKTLNDAFVLTQADLVSKYNIPQYEIGAGQWLDDNTFLVFVTDGAVSYDEIIVHKDADNSWKLTVFPIPNDASIVTAWNPDGYWIAYNNGPGWIGAEEIAQDIYRQWRAEGKTQSLFAYNLATKQKIILASNVDPAWSFKTRWISTTTLEYYIPLGEKKIFSIPQ